MKDQENHYEIYRKIIESMSVGAVKVGGSNQESNSFFCHDEYILGFLPKAAVFDRIVKANYELAEIEVIFKVCFSADNIGRLNYQVIDTYLGVECPRPGAEYQKALVIDAIGDNCGAHALLLLEKIESSMRVMGDLFINHSGSKVVFDAERLIGPPHEILERTLEMLRNMAPSLSGVELYIATGGISDVFTLRKGDLLTVVYR